MIIYFSGPHGAGKSSLISGVCEYSPDFIAYLDRLKFCHMEEPRIRHKSKIAKLYQEYCDQQNFKKENPGKIILGDRCMYDSMVYGRVYERLGYLTKQENKLHEEITLKWFDEKPEHLIVLNPPLECLVDHLRKRWESGKKKWHEEDMKYLNIAREEFEKLPEYFAGRNILYIDEDLPIGQEVNRVVDWIKEKKIIKEKVLEEILV